MSLAAPSPVAPSFRSLPYDVEHRASRTAAIVLMALLVPVLAAVLLPAALMLTFAAHDLWDAAAHKPLPATILAAGLIAWIGLLLAAAKHTLQHFGTRRRVRIAGGHVTVNETGLLRATRWSAPLGEFKGIAHHVRATLSGVRHELILVHSVRSRSVLLYAAPAIAQATIDDAARLLGRPQVAAAVQQRGSQRGSVTSIVAAMPEARTA
jgi:hypothetical protein